MNGPIRTRTTVVALALILATSMGVVCTGPCAPKIANCYVESIAPPSGPVPEPTVDIVVEAVEDSTVNVCYFFSISLSRWNEQQGWWESAGIMGDSEYGEWGTSPSSECARMRTITVTFPNVPLNPGENRFRVESFLDGCDGWEDEWETYEVTYTR